MNQAISGTAFVVDDDAGVREALKHVLTVAGYTVRAFANGREALDALTGGAKTDLMVVDVMMPEMTGPELIAALRASPSLAHLPVIVLTASKGHSAAEMQVDAVLLKPFNTVDVEAAVFLARANRARKGH